MGNVRRIYVEKKAPFAVKARELHEEMEGFLGIKAEGVRVFIRYDVENISDEIFEKACKTVFSEPPVEDLYLEDLEVPANARVFLFYCHVNFLQASSSICLISSRNKSVTSKSFLCFSTLVALSERNVMPEVSTQVCIPLDLSKVNSSITKSI